MRSATLLLFAAGTLLCSGQAQTQPQAQTQTKMNAPKAVPRFTLAPQGQEEPGSKQAREVIDRTIQALGGEAYLNIHDVYQDGRSGSITRQGESEGVVPFSRWVEFPDKERAELLKTHEWIIVYNGDKAWDITYHGAHPLAEDELKDYLLRRSHSLEIVLRQWVSDPKTIYFSNGEMFAEAKQCYSVTLINGQNQSVTLLVDKQTYLPVKKSWSDRDQYKEKFTEDEVFDKYRDVQGFPTAFVISRLRDGRMTCQAGPSAGSSTAPATQPLV